MYKLYFIFFLVIGGLKCNAQKIESEEIINCIKDKVHLFFVEIDRSKDSNSNSIHIYEIKDKKVLGYNDTGIFACTDLSSHRKTYLFLKRGCKILILNSVDSISSFEEILLFLKDMNLSNKAVTEYLITASEILNENTNKIMDNQVDTKTWIDCCGNSSN